MQGGAQFYTCFTVAVPLKAEREVNFSESSCTALVKGGRQSSCGDLGGNFVDKSLMFLFRVCRYDLHLRYRGALNHFLRDRGPLYRQE